MSRGKRSLGLGFWRALTARIAFLLVAVLAALGPAAVGAEVLDELTVFPEGANAVVRITFGVRIQYLRHTVVGDRLIEISFQILTDPTSAVTESRRLEPTASFPGVEVTYPFQPRLQPRKIIVLFSHYLTFRIRPAGNRAIDIVVPGAAQQVVRPPVPEPKVEPAPVAEDRFAIRLESFPTLADMRRAKPIPGEIYDQYAVFTSQFVRDGETEHEILLGYFTTAEAAERVRRQVLKRFPGATVIDLVQRRQESLLAAARRAKALAARKPAPPVAVPAVPAPPAPPVTVPVVPAPPAPPVAVPAVPIPPAAADVEARAGELIASARAALDAGNAESATAQLNQVLMLPPNSQSQDAQELVGLARERSGEIAKARAEYELYLKLFPEDEGAARVRARLAALAAPAAPDAARRERPPARTFTGSLSQYYYGGRTRVDTVFNTPTTADRSTFTAVDQSSLVTNLDFTLRDRSASADTRFVFRDTGSVSFLKSQASNNRLNAAYYDYRGLQNSVTARLGRQTGLSGGLPNRFDGVIAGYGLAEKWRLNAAAGVPVEYPSIDADRRFWAANLEFENLFGSWSGNVFHIDQRVDGILDRRAVGAETRYFSAGRSLFTLVDYDTSYKVWNVAMVQGTWQTQGRTTINFLFDRRRAPLLSTTNAIFGQGTTSVSTLLKTLTEEQVRQQARDVTATAKQFLGGFTTPVSPKWQAGADLRLTNVGALPAVVVNGVPVPAQPATGNIYSYDIQAIGTNLYSSRDTNVFSATYLTGPAHTGYLLAYNNLSLIQGRWTVEPSLRYYSQKDTREVKLERWMPGLRLTYRVRESVSLETEFNWEKTRTVGPTSQDDTDRGFFFIGYRWDI